MKKRTFFSALIVLIPLVLYSVENEVIVKAASQICKISSSKNKSRLAIFAFTDDSDRESPETKKVTTVIIGRVLTCSNIKVIDQSKVKQILKEQSKGLTGIIDEETAPETGKLIGADVLVFGQVDKKSIQIRLIDAETGEILGSTIEGVSNSNKVEIKEEKFNTETSKKKFRLKQVRRELRKLARNRPLVFMLVTSTNDEIRDYKDKLPGRFSKLIKRIKKDKSGRKIRFKKMRRLVLETRNINRKVNGRILKTHERIISRMNRNHGRKRGSHRGMMRPHHGRDNF